MKFVNEAVEAYPSLLPVLPNLESTVHILEETVNDGCKILICGNGGSAADSDHIAGELMKGFLSSRNLSQKETKALQRLFPEDGTFISKQLQQGIPAVSLASHNALMTAIINDQDPTVVFAQQIQALGKPGDTLIAISTSGNSKNVLMAAKIARALEMRIIGLTGKEGGRLSALCDVCINVPAQRVDRIQEMHLPIYHALCAQLEHNLFDSDADADGTDRMQSKESVQRFQPVPNRPKLVVFDFDGVFTDNKVYTDQNGTETVKCDRRDSLGLNMLKAHDVDMFILTQETNPVVTARAKKMGVPIYSGCSTKRAFLETYLKDAGIDPADVIYMGNDLNDLGAMALVGYAVAPADAHTEVKSIANLVVSESGGNGAVRNLCEIIIEKLEG